MVWGEPHIVTVYRKSEIVYEAIGNYMCETICVNDQSEGAAIKRWREAAAGISSGEQLTRTAGWSDTSLFGGSVDQLAPRAISYCSPCPGPDE